MILTKQNDLYYSFLLDMYYFWYDTSIDTSIKYNVLSNFIDYFPRLMKDIQNIYDKAYRVRKRIKRIIENSSCPTLITFTFTDSSLKAHNMAFFENYLKVLLRGSDYIFNRDFGAINGRLHYHCILDHEFCKDLWIFGAVNFVKIKNKNAKSLGYYLYKLSLHSIKNSKVIYSRKCYYNS